MSAVTFSDAPPAVNPAARERPHLTPRETQALDAAADGLTNAGIAERLGVSPNAAKALLATAAEKLGTGDRAAMVARCYLTGIFTAPAGVRAASGVLSRELFDVLLLIARGATDERIAIECGLTPDVAKSRVVSLRGVLGAANRAHAVRRAIEVGALTLVPKSGAR